MFELLAPAGDIKSFDTAIACGADAVYLGLSDFNARRKAENFTSENIAECIKKAHFYGVKVYVTMNTLVRDDEICSALQLAKSAVLAGVDAFIVQDLGLAKYLKLAFPNVALHASTQLGIHNLYGAQQIAKLGFKRVVLSRETKLDDIKAIKNGTNLEIEYFVQGALCVAFSGNCYLSASECGASGNRGLCKQLCRLPYEAQAGGKTAKGYLLSAKDLCLAGSLKELIEAGVTSFKIEGRMRREGYVGTAVSVYRKLLDNAHIGETVGEDSLHMLRLAYSRGNGYLERAYLDNGTPSVIEKRFNNHTGIKIGYVKRVKPFKADLYEVTVSSKYPIASGDGLKFFVAVNGELKEQTSLGVGDVKQRGENEYVFVTKTSVKEGWQVNMILSKEQESRVGDKRRYIEVTVELCASVGNPLYIKATCANGICAEVYGEICQKAINQPTDIKTFEEQIKKTGDSGFYVKGVSVHTDDVFVAKSVINVLRRRLFDVLAEKCVKKNTPECRINECVLEDIVSDVRKYSPIHRIKFYHSDEVADGATVITDVRKAELAVLCPSNYVSSEVRRMLQKLSLTADKVALQLPVIAGGEDLAVIEKLLEEMPQIKTLVSENAYGLEFADKGYKVIAGAGHNVLNGVACQVCLELGASGVLPSLESAYRDKIAGDELPLMTFAHCPYRTVFENDCKHCSYTGDMTVLREKHRYHVRRTKLRNCYFGLFDKIE